MLLFFFGGDMSCYMLLLSLLLKWVLYTHVEWVVHVSTRFGCSSAHPRKKRRLDLCYLIPALYSYHFHISQQGILKHLWGYSLSTWAVVSISRQHAGKHSSKKTSTRVASWRVSYYQMEMFGVPLSSVQESGDLKLLHEVSSQTGKSGWETRLTAKLNTRLTYS